MFGGEQCYTNNKKNDVDICVQIWKYVHSVFVIKKNKFCIYISGLLFIKNKYVCECNVNMHKYVCINLG